MINALRRLVAQIETAMNVFAGGALILMMLVVVADIVGRNLGLCHILSTVEQIQLYMMFLGFFGLALCFRNEGNIVVDVATQNLPDRLVGQIDALWGLCTAIVLVPLGVMVIQDGTILHGYGQRSEILGLSPLVHYTIAGIGLMFAGLLTFLMAVQTLRSKEKADDAKD